MKTLPVDNNFLAIEEEYSSYEKSSIAIISAPYEHTVSYGGGTKNGPASILDASAYVEFYDDEFDCELCFTHGIATLEPIDFGNSVNEKALSLLQQQVERVIQDNKFAVTLGGEHTISTAPILAHYKHHPSMSILHFDAHSDLRDTYEDSKYSHACFMARILEAGFPPEHIVQVGIRAQCKEEAELIREQNINTFYASAIRRGLHSTNDKTWQQEIADNLTENVYVTFDVDYFDPAIMPATGTPEPDGFLYSETLDVFRALGQSGKKIIGFDVVELAPLEGLSHPNLTTARLIYKMMNYAFAQ
jgi:agmatinase